MTIGLFRPIVVFLHRNITWFATPFFSLPNVKEPLQIHCSGSLSFLKFVGLSPVPPWEHKDAAHRYSCRQDG